MMDNLLKLYEFQKVDMELYTLEEAIKKSKSRKKMVKAKNVLLEGKKTAQEYEDSIEAKKNEIEEIISKYDSLSAQVEELVKESANIEDGEAAKLMKKKAEDVNAKLKKVQAGIVDGINKVKNIKNGYHDLMTNLQSAKKEYTQSKEIHAKEIEDSKDKIEELKSNVKKLEKGLDKKLYDVYKKKRENGMPVVVKVNDKDRQCVGCFMELPLSVFEAGKDGIVECENCGRILLFE